METLKAAKCTIKGDSSIWDLAQEVVCAHVRTTSDMFVIDTQWLMEDELEEEDGYMSLAKALDKEPACEGWRSLDLLYLWSA